jgi:hypothetical protein
MSARPSAKTRTMFDSKTPAEDGASALAEMAEANQITAASTPAYFAEGCLRSRGSIRTGKLFEFLRRESRERQFAAVYRQRNGVRRLAAL